MVRWVGFRTAVISVRHAKRQGGKTGYTLGKMVNLAMDIILTYSDKPLRLIFTFGIVVTLCSGTYLFIVAVRESSVVSVASFEIFKGSLWLMFGLLSTMLGVIALYLGKMFNESKHRPIYIVREEI
jgi:dolichol-phosphate mannosyltransferase